MGQGAGRDRTEECPPAGDVIAQDRSTQATKAYGSGRCRELVGFIKCCHVFEALPGSLQHHARGAMLTRGPQFRLQRTSRNVNHIALHFLLQTCQRLSLNLGGKKNPCSLTQPHSLHGLHSLAPSCISSLSAPAPHWAPVPGWDHISVLPQGLGPLCTPTLQ